MTSNKEIVELLKKGDPQRTKFFQDMLKKELKNSFLTEEEKDKLIKETLTEAMDSYQDENTIFAFYLKRILKQKEKVIQEKETSLGNQLFSKEEMLILNLYQDVTSYGYLDNHQIAAKLHLSLYRVKSVEKKLAQLLKRNREDILTLFPNLKENLKLRASLQEKQKQKLTEEEIKLIAYFTGEINDVCLDLPDLAKRFYLEEEQVKQKLAVAIKKLDLPNNQEQINNRYPSALKMLEVRKKIIEEPATPRKKEKKIKKKSVSKPPQEKSSFSITDKELLKQLQQQEENFLTKEEVIKNLHMQSYKSFLERKARLFDQLKTNPTLFQEAQKIYPNLNLGKPEYILKDSERLLLRALNKQQEENLSLEEIEQQLNYTNKNNLSAAIKRVIQKINTFPLLKKRAFACFPHLPALLEAKQVSISNQPKLSKEEQEQRDILFLQTLERQYTECLPTEEMAELLSYPTKVAFRQRKNELLRRIRTNPNWKKKAEQFFPHYPLAFSKQQLTSAQRKLLRLLKEQQENMLLTNQEIIKQLKITSNNSFLASKRKLFACLKEKERLEQVISFFPNVSSLWEEKPPTLTPQERKLLKLLKRQQEEWLTTREVIQESGYSSSGFYKAKAQLLTKLKKENPQEFQKLTETIESNDPAFSFHDGEKMILRLWKQQIKDPSLTEQQIEIELAKVFPLRFNYQKRKKKLIEKLKENEALQRKVLAWEPQLEELWIKSKAKEPLGLTANDLKRIKLCKREQKELLTDQELDQEEQGPFKIRKITLREKILHHPEVLEEAKKIEPNILNYLKPLPLRTSSRLILRALKAQQENPTLTDQEMAQKLSFSTLEDYQKKKKALLKRIQQNQELVTLLTDFLPDPSILENKKSSKTLSEAEIALLKIYQKQYHEFLTSEEAIKELGISSCMFYQAKQKLTKDIQEHPELMKEAKKIFPKFSGHGEKQITKQMCLLVRSLKKQQENFFLQDRQIAEDLGYSSIRNYSIAKAQFFGRIKQNPPLEKRVFEFLDRDLLKTHLLDSERQFLQVLQEYANLDDEQRSKILHYSQIEPYQHKKARLKRKINSSPILAERFSHLFEPPKQEITPQEISQLQQTYQLSLDEEQYQKVEEKEDLKRKDKNNLSYIIKEWPSFEENVVLREQIPSQEKIALSEEEIKNLKKACQRQEEKKEQDSKSNLVQGILTLESSIFGDYVKQCTFEQKTMLALRFGYFNQQPMAVSDIAEIFQVEKEEVRKLTKECLLHSKELLQQEKAKKKIKKDSR